MRGAAQVFRRLYEAVGLGWVYAITRLPLVGRLADACDPPLLGRLK